MSDTPIYDSMHTEGKKPANNTPQPKVVAATVGSGVGVAMGDILVWVVETFAKIDIPAGVELSIEIVIAAGLAFVAGFYKRN